MGYWISMFGFLIFPCSYYFSYKLVSWKKKAVCPAIILFLFGLASLWNFKPEFPHGGIFVWFLEFSIASMFSGLIYHCPATGDWFKKKDINKDLKKERIKESITLWRTASFSITFGYIALLIPWSNFIWNLSPKIVTEQKDIFLLSVFGAAQLTFFSIYFLFRIIYESFKKAHVVADLLLKIN